ncbi:hypothetical protein DHEL01_v211015 [Diaporthe helianthi]|uniref:Small secreted protein n=1 Tax=Diaporthe helianthi TaxID=158607 RepID=A0A2P5HK09_DIAHE|nr:hypothetical protein DHEL01_v211015 [Diaporthe helianthi]
MQITSFFVVLAAPAMVLATLDPARSHTKGKCPKAPACAPTKVSKAIQAAECSHNTRVAGQQTFAVFETDHKYDKSHGAPYGTCSAYMCAPPTSSQMKANGDCWTFFWTGKGEKSGEGAGCIKSPKDGKCGCENSNGKFIAGASNCK